jgi:hypothetical protein
MINKFDENKSFYYENGFYLTSQPYRIGNILAHYEVYKKTTNIPGGVIEIGVFKGGSLIQWATFRELLENENSRKIVGFDMFGQFPLSNTVPSDEVFINKWNNQFSNEFVSKEEIEASLQLKKINNVQLIKGDICETLPIFLKENPAFRISLLHIDTDVYNPCKVALEYCWDRIVPDGIVLFDDYATIEGETLAIEEFLEGKHYSLYKFPFSHEKPSYLIKQ